MVALWNPPVELSSREQKILKRCAKRRVFVFLLSMGPKMRADLVKIADRPQISSPSETTPSSRRSPGRAADAATGG